MSKRPIIDEGPSRGLHSARDVAPLTKGAGSIPETRALLVGTPGTANIVTASGASRSNVPLVEGVNPIRITELLAGGTADNIWAMY